MDRKLIEKYLEYAQTDEAYAILFVKKNLRAAKNHWIDIISYDNARDFDHSRLHFKTVECELFKKRLKPKYPDRKEHEDDATRITECRAITWMTAQKDIDVQRRRNVKGKKFRLSGVLVKSPELFVENAPPEIKALEAEAAANDYTNPLWDVADIWRKHRVECNLKYVKRIDEK